MQSSAAQHFIVISLLNRLNAICQSTHFVHLFPAYNSYEIYISKLFCHTVGSFCSCMTTKKYVYCIHIECRSTFFIRLYQIFVYSSSKYLHDDICVHIRVISARQNSHRKRFNSSYDLSVSLVFTRHIHTFGRLSARNAENIKNLFT